MTERQTIGEGIRLAVRSEQQAYDFLMAMRGCVKSASIRLLLEDLAGEELEHKEKLELELMKLGEVVYSQEIQGQAQNPYYIESDECADMDYAELLRFCIGKEDVSFRLYIDLSTQVHDEQAREVFIALAEEEVRHKLRLETEYSRLLEQQ